MRQPGVATTALPHKRDWPRFCTALELQELIEDPRFKTDEARIDNRQSMNAILHKVLVRKSSEYWLDKLLAASIPCTVIENVKSIANSKLSEEYQAFSTVKTGSGRGMRFVRNPIAEPEFIETAAPALGQHTAEIMAELELT